MNEGRDSNNSNKNAMTFQIGASWSGRINSKTYSLSVCEDNIVFFQFIYQERHACSCMGHINFSRNARKVQNVEQIEIMNININVSETICALSVCCPQHTFLQICWTTSPRILGCLEIMETVVPPIWRIVGWAGGQEYFITLGISFWESFFIVLRNFQNTSYLMTPSGIWIYLIRFHFTGIFSNSTITSKVKSYQINSDPWWCH